MAGFDVVVLVVLGVSALVGFLRGLVFELLSLTAWFVAYVVALSQAHRLAPHIPVGLPGSGLNQSVAMVLTFIGVLIVGVLLARLARFLLSKTPLSFLDRTLGAGFGVVRAGLILTLVAVVILLTPVAQNDFWLRSASAPWMRSAVLAMKPWLPEAMARGLPN